MKNPECVEMAELQKIAGFDISEPVELAKNTGKKIDHPSGWTFWLLGDWDEEERVLYDAMVWAFAPNGERYIIRGTVVERR
jgi:hypothetical protein